MPSKTFQLPDYTAGSDQSIVYVPLDNTDTANRSERIPLASIGGGVDFGTITIRSKDGAVVPFVPTADTDAARGTALSAAYSALVDEDVMTLGNGRQYQGTGATLWSINGPSNVTINGNNSVLTRDPTATFRVMLEFDTVSGWQINDLIFDSQGGMEPPTIGSPASHINVNDNENGFANAKAVDLVSGTNMTFSRCQFRDIIGPISTTMNGGRTIAEYAETHGIYIQQNSSGTRVLDCRFWRCGYGGIIDYADNTEVSRCHFEECMHTGLTIRKQGDRSGLYVGNHFTNPTLTGVGYSTTINVNPVAQINNKLIFRDNTFDFPFEDTTADAGMFLIKLQDVDEVVIDGGNMYHEQNASSSAPGNNDSIRSQGANVGKVTISRIRMSGAIGSVTAPRQVKQLVVDDCEVNADYLTSTAIWMHVADARITNTKCFFTLAALWPPSGGDKITDSLSLRNNRFVTTGGAAAYVVPAAYIEDIAATCMCDETNLMSNDGGTTWSTVGLGSGSSLLRLSETAPGRLNMTTGSEPKEKRFDVTLTGDFSHGTALALTPNIKRLEANGSVPHVAAAAGVLDLDESNYQKVTPTGNIAALTTSRSLTAADEGTYFRVWIKPGAFTVDLNPTWDPDDNYVQPSHGGTFLIGFDIAETDTPGTYLPRFAGVI